ncbi:response regulator transcription factor [Dyella sp. S184]|jgi:DNA-binding NarL/FixJ family response regulator|uniref:response regulator n=1 Tax=Dyella sp. S184 TaxID=1641862 RepID=UPI00131C0E38|nr:response regulator transcription factor [Dyella sp. S184]
MSVQPKIKVLVVDDHPVVRTGLGAIVSSQRDLELVGQAATAAEAIALFEAHSPDISLVDLSLPDRSGVEVIATLRAKSPLAKFVVLTANLGSSDISKALQAGAHAYLFKDATSDELLTTIRTVSRGGRYLSPAVGSKLDKTTSHPDLTARELEVLHCLVRGLSNAQVAKKLAVTEETVKTHVGNILGKLGVASRSKAVALSLKSGLVQLDDM